MIHYSFEYEYPIFFSTEGIIRFDVLSGRYDFDPFNFIEGYNPDFHSFL